MTSSPWLTVVTVTKDDPDGLRRTLRSLQVQDHTGVECLIIDSSGDRAYVVELAREYGDFARVIWVEPSGIYSAMNSGLRDASGEFVYFLNGGDELASDDVLAHIRSRVTVGTVDWAYGAIEIVHTDGSRIVTPPWDFANEREHAFSRGHFPAHQGTVVRTEVLRRVGGFDPSFRIAADYATFLRLAQVGPPVELDVTVAQFHEGGVSTTQWARSLREFHRARLEILHPTGELARRERWATAQQYGRMAIHRSPWPLVAVLSAIVLVFMGVTGVAWGSAALLTGCVVAQGLAGAIWWRLLRPTRSVPILEAVGMGLGVGTAGAMLVGLGLPWWLAPTLALVTWAAIRSRRTIAPLAPLERPDLLALVVGLVPGVGSLFLAVRSYPLTWTGLWSGYHGDMPFFEALSTSVARLGPGASIFMSGADLRYHSLAYGWAGQLTQTVNAEPFVVLTRLLPAVTLVAVIALAASWTRRLTRTWWAPSLAVCLIVTGGFVGATYGSVLNFDSPSQSMGDVWLLALSVLLLQCLDRTTIRWQLIAVIALVAALTGGKISTVAVAAGGFAFVVVLGVVRRAEWRWRALAVGIVALITLLVTYELLLAGSSNSGGLGLFSLLDRASSVQGLNPVITPRGIVAGIALLMIAVVPRWAGLAWLMGDRETRWQPATLYGVGLAVAGLSTIAILSGGFNDLWFAVAASAPLAVLSAVGTVNAVAWLGPRARQRVLVALVCGLVGSILVAAVWTTGSTGVIGQGWRWAGPVVGVLMSLGIGVVLTRGDSPKRRTQFAAYALISLVAMALPGRLIYAAAEPLARTYEGSFSTVLFTGQREFVTTIDNEASPGWTDTQAAAGAWLRSHANPDDLLATNVTSGAIVPALSRLTTYISDLHMQAPYGRTSEIDEALTREKQTWAFVNTPTSETAAPLCRAGVVWLWIDPSRTTTRDWQPYATVVWQEAEVILAKIDSSACP